MRETQLQLYNSLKGKLKMKNTHTYIAGPTKKEHSYQKYDNRLKSLAVIVNTMCNS